MKTALALSAAALALLSASVSAHAAPSFNSDTLTVGRTTAGLNESDEPPGQVEISGTVLTEFGIAGTHTVTLTDPGTNNISDIVSATISSCLDAFCLAVTLTSDVETPLLSTGDASFAETGAPQNLTRTFNGLFGLTNLPTIEVTSDVSDVVPEPSTWVMMLLGFAGLGIAGYRVRRNSAVVA